MIVSSIRRAAGLAAGVVAAELVWAVARPVPAFEDLDASGVEGDPNLPPLTITVLGDSTCTGPGLDDPGDIWVRQLAKKLTDRFFVEVRSHAVGGSRAQDVRRDQLGPATRDRADIAIVSIGGNDALKGVSVKRFEHELDAIASALVGVGDLVVLSGVGDLGSIPRLMYPLDEMFRRRGLAMNAAHARVAERHGVVMADQWSWAAEHFRMTPALFSPDLFHPTAEGHALWAEVAFETIEPYVGRFTRN